MDQAVFVRSDLNECAEIHDADYFPIIDSAGLNRFYDQRDDLQRAIDHFFIYAKYIDTSVIVDVDLNTGLIDDAVDNLTLLADHFTDLLRIDGHLLDLRSVFSNFRSRFGDYRFHHVGENVFSGFFGSGDGFLDDGRSKTMDLDIHLNGCDTVMGTGYFKVHVSKEVFQTLDIGKNNVIIVCVTCHKTCGDTCYRLLDRDTCCHQRQSRCTYACLRCGTIGFHGLGYSTDCIRKLFLCRKYRYQGLLCQCSVTDLTTSRTSAGLCLTNRVAREVIMMHISLGCHIDINTIHFLCFGQRS